MAKCHATSSVTPPAMPSAVLAARACQLESVSIVAVALPGQIEQDAIRASRVVLRLKTAKGTDSVPWPSCFGSKATLEGQPSAFVWTGHEGDLGQDLVRLFDDGAIVFEWRSRPPARLDEVVVVDFDLLALDALAFVRLSAATYARAAKFAGISVAAPYTVELTLDLPKDHRRIVALFRGPDSFVRPRELMRTAHIKKSRVVVSRLLPVSAAERRDAVADALVGLLGGVADEFDLEINELFSSGVTPLHLDKKSYVEDGGRAPELAWNPPFPRNARSLTPCCPPWRLRSPPPPIADPAELFLRVASVASHVSMTSNRRQYREVLAVHAAAPGSAHTRSTTAVGRSPPGISTRAARYPLDGRCASSRSTRAAAGW